MLYNGGVGGGALTLDCPNQSREPLLIAFRQKTQTTRRPQIKEKVHYWEKGRSSIQLPDCPDTTGAPFIYKHTMNPVYNLDPPRVGGTRLCVSPWHYYSSLSSSKTKMPGKIQLLQYEHRVNTSWRQSNSGLIPTKTIDDCNSREDVDRSVNTVQQ